MSTPGADFVPKVHPLTRDVEAEDPMELIANPVVGDPGVMLQCMIQEFAWMGWGPEELLGLFHSPEYPVLNQLREHYGEDAIRQRIEDLVGESGVFQVSGVLIDEVEPEEEEPELVPLSMDRLFRNCEV